jgi:hypothetical protein
MAIHNKPLYDSVLAAIAASNGAWLFDSTSADYSGQANVAVAIATEVDALISAIPSGATLSQRTLLESIVKSVMAGRSPRSTNAANYLSIAQAIVAIFTQFATKLQDTSTGAGGGSGAVGITDDVSLLLPNGEATGGVATSPFPPVVYAIVGMSCDDGQRVLLQFTPVYWLALSEENIGDFIQLQWQYCLNGINWLDVGTPSNELGNDTAGAVVLSTLNRVYTHVGAHANIQFRVNVVRISGAVAGDISARNGSLIASRF